MDTSNAILDSTANLDSVAQRSPQPFQPQTPPFSPAPDVALTENSCTNIGEEHGHHTDEEKVEGERDGNSVSEESGTVNHNMQHAIDPEGSTDEAKVSTTDVHVHVAEGGFSLPNPPPPPLEPSPDQEKKSQWSVEQLKELMKEAKAKEKADEKKLSEVDDNKRKRVAEAKAALKEAMDAAKPKKQKVVHEAEGFRCCMYDFQ